MARGVFNKVSICNPTRPKELSISMSVTAMNDTAGLNDLVSSLLLFYVPETPIWNSRQSFDIRNPQNDSNSTGAGGL